MIFGLGAALGWGLADLWAAMSGRQLGAWTTLAFAQITSVAIVTALALFAGADLGSVGPIAGWVVPTGLVAAAAYLTLYRGLELGPVTIVSPILATYAVVPVVLAVALLGESLGALQVTAIVVTISGAALTSTDLRALVAGTHRTPKGLPWAVASMLLFGIATYVLGWATKQVGWLAALWLARISTAGVIIVVATFAGSLGRRDRPRALAVTTVGFAAAVGVVDLFGTLMYSRGASVGLVSIVTAASATYPLLPVLGSVALLRERPVPNQYLGVVMVITGLALLALVG